MIYYDFHIHSALSPCSSDDMTPNNIVNMAMLCGLDAIAVTDHNSCRNLPAVFAVAERTENAPVIVPGMELETQEEIHVLCLFPDLSTALAFEEIVDKTRPDLQNRPEIFGNQPVMDDMDETLFEFEPLLLSATNLDIYTAVKFVKDMGGIAIPAHIDRDSYSILTNLGFMPEDLGANLVEYSKRCDPSAFYKEHKPLFSRRYPYIRNSDAHMLLDISEQENMMDVPKNSTPKDIIQHLLSL